MKRALIGDMADIDTGSVRRDLVHLARQFLELYLGPAGPAAVGLEVGRIPALQDRHDALGDSQRLAARAIVRRAIDRGEVPAGTSVTLLLDTLCGGAVFHALTVQPGTRAAAVRDSGAYAQRLADFVLRAATGS